MDVPGTRLYGGTIAIVNGAYALWRATMGEMMMAAMTQAWLMGALGVVILVHGVLLFTPVARSDAMARVSGPLMIGYAVLMLAQQAWLALAGMAAMAADAGMVALAFVMLASGVIMTTSGGERRTTGRPAP